jgi:hypothetical protein
VNGDRFNRAKLALRHFEELVGIMRLNPIAEKSRRHGDGKLPVAAFFRLHAHEPGRIQILAKLGPEALCNIVPTALQSVLLRIRHGSFDASFFVHHKPGGVGQSSRVNGISRFRFAPFSLSETNAQPSQK